MRASHYEPLVCGSPRLNWCNDAVTGGARLKTLVDPGLVSRDLFWDDDAGQAWSQVELYLGQGGYDASNHNDSVSEDSTLSEHDTDFTLVMITLHLSDILKHSPAS